MSFRHEVAAWSTIIFVAFGGAAGCTHLANSQEGDALCYSNFTHAYTWQAIRPQLREFWTDRKLTEGECFRMLELYEDAKANVERDRTKQQIDRMIK